MGENLQRYYVCIDLKSFYASVECVERGLNPLKTNLVVADISRTEKTICLAVSPSLKSYGIPGRARLFEVVQRVKEVNRERKANIGGKAFKGSSYDDSTLKSDPFKELTFIVAPPRMAKYVEISTKIYDVYLKYIAPEDMHVYSIDEVFLDVTAYLKMYKKTPRELAVTIIKDVLLATGITATVGIGTNLYLAKIAMDIVAKKMPPDSDGVRIAELDETSFRKNLWSHTPLTDFWRIGNGISKRLNKLGLFTMGDVAKCSLGEKNSFLNEDVLYKEFGVNAELIIDHAWGYEPTVISDIKSYRPSLNSLMIGQVLERGYENQHALTVVKEMADSLALDILSKNALANVLVLTVGYDVENLTDNTRAKKYNGEIETDRYGRKVPKGAHGSVNFGEYTSSVKKIVSAACELFKEISDDALLIRRLSVSANVVYKNGAFTETILGEQLGMFDEPNNTEREKDEKISRSVIEIKNKYGKNALLKGVSLEEGATQIKRNGQIGGHKA